jgi:two-component system, NarL family, nitrate/nitrite sensor histidine kinase NarX
VIPIRSDRPANFPHCANAGYQTVVCIPVRHHSQIKGEINLFFHAQYELSAAERSLLEALATHLAAAMENLRLGALEREALVAQERGFIARELHDSIAQSLAFLKMQVQLLRDAQTRGDATLVDQAVSEIDEGVRESYGDVRELLLHFRTRANVEDIEPALQTTLRKFEHQSGIRAQLSMQGHGISLAPDLQLQVLHVLQEALSNARKHSGASRVWLDVQQQPQWRFEVRDDGQGFAQTQDQLDETHVGLRIMAERAERIGAKLDVLSTVDRGTSVILTLAADKPTAAVIALDNRSREARISA